MMDENKLLLASLTDKYERFLQYEYLIVSDFLNLSQQSAVSGLLKRWRAEGTRVFLFGGLPDAERRMVVFVPSYMEIADEAGLLDYFRQNPQDCPLVLLDLKIAGGQNRGGRSLSHRDYLGSLLGEGIRREKMGDILVRTDGAQAVVTRELGEYLQMHYGKAGNVSLDVEVLPISAADMGVIRRETVEFTVTSPRLDSIVAGVFHLSRKDAQTAIARGLVFVNETEMLKPDHSLKGGEKLVLRGKGKAIYQGVSGTSKKGKVYVTLEKFV